MKSVLVYTNTYTIQFGHTFYQWSVKKKPSSHLCSPCTIPKHSHPNSSQCHGWPYTVQFKCRRPQNPTSTPNPKHPASATRLLLLNQISFHHQKPFHSLGTFGMYGHLPNCKFRWPAVEPEHACRPHLGLRMVAHRGGSYASHLNVSTLPLSLVRPSHLWCRRKVLHEWYYSACARKFYACACRWTL